jgi:hypothetical protein
MHSPDFFPVADPYQATVLVGYLDRAFNSAAPQIPPRQSPMWPIAVRMIEAMGRDNYSLGAYPQAYRSRPRHTAIVSLPSSGSVMIDAPTPAAEHQTRN